MNRPGTKARTPQRAPAWSLPWWGAACFFASGAAGLLYEVVWSKQLAYVLGSSLHSVATVVAAFLCGLALGARVLGVPLARRGDGVRTYAALEVGIAVLGVISLPVLRGLEPLVGELYRGLGGEGPGFALARFALLFGVLLPPTALMGATLPVLVAHFEQDLVGPGLARLYALNTLGAVAGSVLGGFALLPGVGLTRTTWIAAGLNGAVALLAWIAGQRSRAAVATIKVREPSRAAPADRQREDTSHAAARVRPNTLDGSSRRLFAVLFALSGLAALTFQIAWVRLFSLMFGSSVYSFSAVLGVYLLGLGIGSAVVGRWMGRGLSLATFARLQLALAALAALMLHAYPRLPEWTYQLAERAGPRWGALFAGELGLTAALLLLPCGLLGAVFPVATRLLQRSDGGHAAGFAYAVNTVGTIAGSLAAGFFAIPTWGVQGTHLGALLLSLAIGLAALLLALSRKTTSPRDLVFGAVTSAIAIGLVALAPRWDPSLMAAGSFRPMQASYIGAVANEVGGVGPTVWRATRHERVLYYREGVNGSVLVGTNDETGNRWLRVGGKIDASTGDMDTQVLVGMLPAALADSGARALVIGHGSGLTTAGVLAGGAGPTEVVELESGVIEASRFFHEAGADPLDDPRVRLILGDARTHLQHSAGRYGLIVSQPSNPWIAGVNNLFTVDFYRKIKARLEPDGVFCQWMQLYEVSPGTFASLVASFLEVFPEGHLFVIWRAVDVLLVAAPADRSLSLERFESPAARRLLKRTNITSPEVLAAYYAGEFSALRPVGAGAPLNRDDRPIVEYRAPRDLVAVGRTSPHAHPEVTALVPFAEHVPDGPLFSAWSKERWYELRARLLAEQGEPERSAVAVRAARAAGFGNLADRLQAEIESDQRRRQGRELFEQARGHLAAGRDDQGRQALERATELDPSLGIAWVLLADHFRSKGDLTAAETALARVDLAAADSPLRVEATLVSGLIELARQRPLRAAERVREAQRLSPNDARGYVLEARALRDGGDVEGAIAAVRRGLASVPGDPDLAALLAALIPPR